MKHDLVSLTNLAQGACIEKFDDELAKVIENILDPNTGEGTREITLKVKITPNEKKDFCKVLIECDSKRSPAKKFETHIYVGWDRTDGTIKATEYNPQQTAMNVSVSPENVVSLKAGGAK